MAKKAATVSEAMIHRRLDFILQEAREGVVTRDQTITFAMRVVSNFYSTGRNGDSNAMKRHCSRMSKAAWELRQLVDEKEWFRRTRNEHQDTLERVWTELVERKGDLTREQLAERFTAYPMVTVTDEEDEQLRLRRKLGPNERYLGVITVMTRQADGSWNESISEILVQGDAQRDVTKIPSNANLSI